MARSRSNPVKRRRWLGGSGGNESTTGRGVDFRARALRVVVVARGCILLWWFAGFAIPSSSPVIVALRDRSFNPDAYDAVGGTIGVFFLEENRHRLLEIPRGTPPDYHVTRRGACLAWGCILPCWAGFERSAAGAIGGSQSLQTSSSVRTTNRTSVFRRRHLYRTFSKNRKRFDAKFSTVEPVTPEV